jgi:VCBS repeat-containing protein
MDGTFTLAEERPADTPVGSVSVSDANSTEGDSLTYAITAGNTGNAFKITSSGQIQVATPTAIDFETTQVFTLTVTVTDAGGNATGGTGLTDTATITINLTDSNDAPNIANQTFQVDENSASGTPVGIVQANDPNPGNTVTFAITGGNSAGAFAINASGQLTVASAAALNFETTPSFSLMVTATDNLGLSRTATITVGLRDENEAPTLNEQTFNVPLNASAGQSVGNMTATDPDANETHFFVVLASNAPFGLFSISVPGAIAVANPSLLVAGSTYTLSVRVTDKAGAGLNDVGTITIVIGAASAAPVAAGDVFQLMQGNTNIGLTVLSNDTDPDPGQTLSVTGVGATETGVTPTIGQNGQTISYTPPAGFIGTDRFTYTVSDGQGGTAQSMVTVQVLAPLPMLSASFQANLSIFVNGEKQANPPANIGVTSPGASQTLVAPIHTEAADGRIHIEPASSGPPAQNVTVNDFFTTWRTNAGAAGNNPNAIFTADQVLDHVRAADEVVRMYVNGLPVAALGNYVIRPEDQIVISVEKTGVVNRPSFVPIADQTVIAGAPLIIPLEGFDPNSTSLTFTASSANTNVVSAQIPKVSDSEKNDSMVLTVQNFGQITYELLESHVPAITSQMIALANSGVLDATLLHRIINGFVFQGLDPTGTGQGHPGLVNFDDQYHVDLQHTSSGLLSMAKGGDFPNQNISGDDTNSSQIFSTDINPAVNPNSALLARRLDFNHSIFAKQTSGENIRRQLMQVPTTPSNPNDMLPDDRPLADITVQDVAIRQIGDKAVLILKAPTGATGTSDVTITARDQQGNEFSQTITVTVQADTINTTPFLSSYPASLQTTAGMPANIQLQVTDAENDPTSISAVPLGLTETILFDNTGDEQGVTPPGTTTFSHFGSNWSGGTVTTTTTAPLVSQGTGAYVFGAGGGEVVFDQPINQAQFFFIHQTGQGPFTARALDANGTQVAMVSSNLLSDPKNVGNFETLSGAAIKRIVFTGGHVDNFFFQAQPVQSAIQANQDTDVVSVTAPSGFTGWMAVRVLVQQTTATQPNANSVIDTQVVRIRVLPAGASAAMAPEDDGDVDEDAVDEVFDELGVV